MRDMWKCKYGDTEKGAKESLIQDVTFMKGQIVSVRAD